MSVETNKHSHMLEDYVMYAGFWKRFLAAFIDIVLLSFISWGIANVAYFIGLWAWRGQTLGQMVVRTRVVKTDGTPIDVRTATLRFIGYIICVLTLGIGFIIIARDSKKQGWHDKIAGTYVITSPSVPNI